jgi:hypothetical protein
MGAFSEILSWVKPNGALFFNADFFAPWGFTAPPSQAPAPALAPESPIWYLQSRAPKVA